MSDSFSNSDQPRAAHFGGVPLCRAEGDVPFIAHDTLRRERLIQRIVANLRTRDVATLESLGCLLGIDDDLS